MRRSVLPLLGFLGILTSCGEDSSSGPGAPAPPPGEAALLFRSGFEAGVVLDPPHVEGGDWAQIMRGADEGYDWESVLSRGTPRNRFTYLVSSGRAMMRSSDAARSRGFESGRSVRPMEPANKQSPTIATPWP